MLKRLPPSEGRNPRVLVPGCGLGRLPYELSQLGYIAEVRLQPISHGVADLALSDQGFLPSPLEYSLVQVTVVVAFMQGNEYNYYMLLTSSFILNHSEKPEEWTIHPWLLSNCNQLSDADQLRAVSLNLHLKQRL